MPIERIDRAEAELEVERLVAVPLTPPQREALVGLVMSIGGTRFSISRLLRLLNDGYYLQAAEEFECWPSDTEPRTEQRALFLSGTDKPTSPQTPDAIRRRR